MTLEEELEVLHTELESASNAGDNSKIMVLSQQVAKHETLVEERIDTKNVTFLNDDALKEATSKFDLLISLDIPQVVDDYMARIALTDSDAVISRYPKRS